MTGRSFARPGGRASTIDRSGLDRCEATRCATRLELICLPWRLVGARGPAAYGPDGMSRARPLVCLDETSKQLIAETRVPIPMKPGRPIRCDYEYERNGTANLFMMFAPLEGWRHANVTDRHTAIDYAHVLKELADIHFEGENHRPGP